MKTRNLVAPVVITALLGGCAVPQNATAPSDTPAVGDPCSMTMSTAAGAAIGAFLGGAINGRKGALAGAAVGGVLGGVGCYAVNVHSRQTKSAAQVDNEYMNTRGSLPPQPQVLAYSARVSSPVVERGKPFRVNSVVELVNGRSEPVREVREEVVLFDPQGQAFKNGSKPLESKNGTSGRFENSFELTLPKGVSQGVYAMKTELYINGRLAATRDLRTQLVFENGQIMVVAGF